MGSDRSYLIVLLLLAIPLGLFLAQIWARSRSPGVARLEAHTDVSEAPPALQPEMELKPAQTASDEKTS